MFGIHQPVEFGGQGLSYKFQLAFLEALGHCTSSGVAMGIGVQGCATPALARHGSDQLRRDYLVPANRSVATLDWWVGGIWPEVKW